MTNKVEAHHVSLRLDEPLPEHVMVGSQIRLKAKAMCPLGCDVDGAVVHLVAGQEVLATSRLVASQDDSAWRETKELSAAAPERLGSFSWLLVFVGQEIGGTPHGQVSLAVLFATEPVATSLAVWDVPATVVIGEAFRIKVGVKSSSACMLEGAEVEILDETGTRKGTGRLGGSPWAGTTALYWAEIEAAGPDKEGPAYWSARFPPTESGLPHDSGLAEFSFVAVKPPDHKLTIIIFDKETAAPIENAQVRLGCFRTATDASGVAELSVPDGHYELTAWIASHELSPMGIEVTEDMELRLQAVALPDEDPYAALWM
jgi:hypothetical protein